MPEPSMTQSRWRLDGVRVVHANELDINTPQTRNEPSGRNNLRPRGCRETVGGHRRNPPQSIPIVGPNTLQKQKAAVMRFSGGPKYRCFAPLSYMSRPRLSAPILMA